MVVVKPDALDMHDAWIDGDGGARWRSGSGHGPGVGAAGSGSSVLEVEPGCRLPRHTDSAEEVIVVLDGRASVAIGSEEDSLGAGDAAVVPCDEPHEVRNAGDRTLRFLAVYAEPSVVTTYEAPVQPDGERQRKPVA